ncbi:uncharacterized protein LOC119482178 [Scomber scombrus]|uniref:Uncharacterized protein LOC119482178 n=1 Tax=Scomber scombrus TaxID=13677 RepID=A0AAV1PCF5_SCOSC
MLPLVFANHYLWREPNMLNMMSVVTLMILVMKPLLLCLICVERYLAVVRPLVYLRYKGPQYRWGCLAVSWLIYIMMTAISVARYASGTVCAVFLPVLAVDTFCSLSVLKTLRKPPPGDRKMVQEKKKKKEKGDTEEVDKRKADSTQSSGKEERVMKEKKSMTRGIGEKNSIKRKAFITIAIIQVVLTFNYVPFIICWAMELFLSSYTIKCQFMPIAIAAACSCSFLQPLLYLHKLGKLPCMTSQKPPDQHLHH